MSPLKGNLQPTDFADSEVRVGNWHYADFYNANACRVWICRCTNWWFQRHEWAHEGRNSTTMDPWILSGYWPNRKWPAHMQPAPEDYDL